MPRPCDPAAVRRGKKKSLNSKRHDGKSAPLASSKILPTQIANRTRAGHVPIGDRRAISTCAIGSRLTNASTARPGAGWLTQPPISHYRDDGAVGVQHSESGGYFFAVEDGTAASPRPRRNAEKVGRKSNNLDFGTGAVGRKKELRRVDAVCVEFNMGRDLAFDFRDYLHECKGRGDRGSLNDRGDFTMDELREKAREFLGLE